MNRELTIAALMLCAAMVLLPTADGITKHLGTVTLYSAGFLGWSRFIVGFVTVTPFALATGAFNGLNHHFLIRQAIRGFFTAGTIFCILNALRSAPLADAYGAFFIAPVVSTLLALVLLKERVSGKEWLAVTIGLVGVLLVVQPSGSLSIGLIWALAAGTSFGCFMVATRWAAGTAPPLAQLSGQMFFGLIFLSPLGYQDLLALGIDAPFIVIAAGLLATLANLFQILAFGCASAAFLAPFVYVQILAALVITWLFFDDIPNELAIIGLCLIVSTALLKIQTRGSKASLRK